MRLSHVAASACLAVIGTNLEAQSPTKHTPDVHFVVTRQPVVEAMLRLARVGQHDVVYDLGSGDGRIVIAAAKQYGATSVGVELDTNLIGVANRKAREAGVADRVRFLRQDLFATDVSSATVVTMYLGPALHRRLRPTLFRTLRPGARIVSHGWDMGEWEPDARVEASGRQLFFWIVPANVAGVWRWRAADGRSHALLLEQRYQRVTGRWVRGGDTIPIVAARLVGDSIAMRAAARGEVFRFVGHVRRGVLRGTTVRNGSSPERWVARRVDLGPDRRPTTDDR